MDTTELDRLIIENLEDLDAVAHRIDIIENLIWKHLGDTGRRWAVEQGWRSSLPDEELWVAPRHWQARGRDVWFELGWGPDDEGSGDQGSLRFDLARLAGVGRGRLCLWLDWRGPGIGPWKTAAGARLNDFRNAGFHLSDGRLVPYMDCTPNPALVAQGLIDGDLSQAYAPVLQALDAAAAAVPTLDLILKKAAR